MVGVLRLGVFGKFDTDMLHHAEIAVDDDMAVKHRIANEALVARAHDDGGATLKVDSVEPLAGKTGVNGVEARACRVNHILALGIADRHDLEWIDVDMEGVDAALGRNGKLPFLDPSQREMAIDPLMVEFASVGEELPVQLFSNGSKFEFLVPSQFGIPDRRMRDEGAEPHAMLKIGDNFVTHGGFAPAS